jgi:DNA-binding transcriptional ArsR family regulator
LDPDRVFFALSDGTRRGILDLLREHESLTAGQLAHQFPDISRPAVSKHLRVLLDADLVAARENGRERHFALKPTALGQVQRAWLDAFVPLWEDNLRRLKRKVEG